jgi:hemolysin activation/secretion protein
VDGDATTAEAHVTRNLVRGRKIDLNVDAGVAWQHLEQDAPGVSLKDQDLLVGTLGVGGRRVFDATRWVLDGRMATNAVGVADGDFDGQDNTTLRVRFDGSAWRPMALPGLGEAQRLRFRLSGQLTTGSLPGTYQLGLGGVGGVRGYEPSIMSVDDGVVGSIEAHVAPWHEERYGSAVLFGDAGYGEQRRAYGGDLWAYLSAVGLGWDWHYGNRFDTQLRWAFPLKTRGSADWLEDDGSRLWFVLRVRPWGS